MVFAAAGVAVTAGEAVASVVLVAANPSPRGGLIVLTTVGVRVGTIGSGVGLCTGAVDAGKSAVGGGSCAELQLTKANNAIVKKLQRAEPVKVLRW